MPALTAPVSNPRSLARSIQIAALTLGSLCAGCQSVDYVQPRQERTPRLVAGLAYKSESHPSSRGQGAVLSDLPAYNGEDVWQRLAQRCRLADGQGINPRIASQREWLLNNRGFMSGASGRAAPYLHYIVERLDERNMPLELALLPMIESSYNPMANSPRAAAGLWQFIPSTGRDFNLLQSATYDARRDVVASSKAAMDYLTRLHDQFDNDWLLALAAYNAGEGTVGRAIEANRRRGLPTDYWHLPLPKETQDYVPRLLALSLVVRNPGAYGVQLTPVANTPYFEVVELNHAVDLTQLAATAGVDEGQLVRLNSAFLRKRTLDGPGRLLIPRTQSQVLTAGIARITGAPPVPSMAIALSEPPVSERLPSISDEKSGRAIERSPVPKAVQPLQVAEKPPLPKIEPAVDVADQPDKPENVTFSPEPELSPMPKVVQKVQTIDDRSSPRKRDGSEYRTGPRELPTGPRVVVYASDPRQ